MMDLYVTGSIGIVGTLLGVLITYRFAIKLANTHANNAARQAEINAFRDAGIRLRAAFTPAIGFLDKTRLHGSDLDRPNASAFLRDAFVTHAAAIEDFHFFVRAKDKAAYQQAWEHYCELNPAHPNSGPVFMAGSVDPWGAIQERIVAVLAFTAP